MIVFQILVNTMVHAWMVWICSIVFVRMDTKVTFVKLLLIVSGLRLFLYHNHKIYFWTFILWWSNIIDLIGS